MPRPPKDTNEYNAHLQLWNYNSTRGIWPTEPMWGEKRVYMQVNGKKYFVRKVDNSYYIGGKYGKLECALLLVETDTDTGAKYGVLQGVRKGTNCSVPPEDGVTTRNVVLIAWKICFLAGLRFLELGDNSMIHCDDGYSYELANAYLLTHGESWYQSIINVAPYPEPEYAAKGLTSAAWTTSQQRIRALKWADVSRVLPPMIQTLVSQYAGAGSAMEGFKAIKDSPIGCWFFQTFTAYLIGAFGLADSKLFVWRTAPITTIQPAREYMAAAERFIDRQQAPKT